MSILPRSGVLLPYVECAWHDERKSFYKHIFTLLELGIMSSRAFLRRTGQMESSLQRGCPIVVRSFYKRKVVPTPNPPTRVCVRGGNMQPTARVAARHINKRSFLLISLAATPTHKVTLSWRQAHLQQPRDKLASAAEELAATTTSR